MKNFVTKNDIYAELVGLGVAKGFQVIPEFRVTVPGNRRKNIDLVWAERLQTPLPHCERKSFDCWTIHATFEIDACDVRNIAGKEFDRHLQDLPAITNSNDSTIIQHFIVLYSTAHDRNWNHNRDVDKEISTRQAWAKNSIVRVIDGRDIFNSCDIPSCSSAFERQ